MCDEFRIPPYKPLVADYRSRSKHNMLHATGYCTSTAVEDYNTQLVAPTPQTDDAKPHSMVGRAFGCSDVRGVLRPATRCDSRIFRDGLIFYSSRLTQSELITCQ